MQKILLLSIGLLLFYVNGSSQKVNTDSLLLISKISADQLKLAKLQNTSAQKMNNKEDALVKAQRSADDNNTAAGKLSDDPENKKLARNAKNKANDAKSDARKGRKEGGKLDNLNRDIDDLKTKIANEQAELNRYTRN